MNIVTWAHRELVSFLKKNVHVLSELFIISPITLINYLLVYDNINTIDK